MSNLSDLKILRDLGIDFNPLDYYGKLTPDYLAQKARELILSCSRKIEDGSKEYYVLSEDGISNIFKDVADGFVFSVMRERNARGHVDLTFMAPLFSDESHFIYKGEAKIWSAYQTAIDGFKQLNGYLNGVPPYGFMLIYYKTKSCDDQFKNYLTKLIDQEGGEVLEKNSRHFITTHKHYSGSKIMIDHFAVHIPPTN